MAKLTELQLYFARLNWLIKNMSGLDRIELSKIQSVNELIAAAQPTMIQHVRRMYETERLSSQKLMDELIAVLEEQKKIFSEERKVLDQRKVLDEKTKEQLK